MEVIKKDNKTFLSFDISKISSPAIAYFLEKYILTLTPKARCALQNERDRRESGDDPNFVELWF